MKIMLQAKPSLDFIYIVDVSMVTRHGGFVMKIMLQAKPSLDFNYIVDVSIVTRHSGLL